MPSYSYYKRILNAYIFNRKRSNLSFWHTPLAVNDLEHVDVIKVRRYPQNFSQKTTFEGMKDNDGVILLNYYGELGYQYNPNAIAQLGLGFYDLYLENPKQEYLDQLVINANWFLNNGRTVKDNILLWEYNFPFEMRQQLEKPWRSALAQGQAISLLVRALQITGDTRYVEAAERGYNAFRYDGSEHEGGVVCHDDKYVWLEEVLISPPNHILNGFIWALWGVYDYARYFQDSHSRKLFDACVDTLVDNLFRYDLGYWTSYDLASDDDPTMIVSHYYQRLHNVQMKGCYNITHNKVFLNYYNKWQDYLDSSYCKYRSLFEKIIFKLIHY